MPRADDAISSVRRIINFLGRTVEFALTGEAHYSVTTSPLAPIEVVDDRVKARRLLEEVRDELSADFHMGLCWPVIVDLLSPGGDLKTALYSLGGMLGRYRSESLGDENAHEILVVKGLGKYRFKAVLAHEMAHAWIREHNLLSRNRVLREGLARWIEYKMLLKCGCKKDALKVKGLRYWTYGKGIRRVLEIEERVGERRVLEFLSGSRMG